MEKLSRWVRKAPIIDTLAQLEHLAALIEQQVGVQVRDRIWPLIRQRRLVILTDDPYLATQARFLQKTLCKQLNAELKLNLMGIDVKVVNLPTTRQSRKITRLPVQPQVVQTLAYIAESINDEGLKQSLLGVAATVAVA
ncbi:DciA family protein [Thiolinea disciformis]|uniref:DciA family protein n=1 Tax=Thiolinea disciformis TaxID=125614 RepID=UPI00035ECC03|nr:DciA family protein [Thiolinea disciformis]